MNNNNHLPQPQQYGVAPNPYLTFPPKVGFGTPYFKQYGSSSHTSQIPESQLKTETWVRIAFAYLLSFTFLLGTHWFVLRQNFLGFVSMITCLIAFPAAAWMVFWYDYDIPGFPVIAMILGAQFPISWILIPYLAKRATYKKYGLKKTRK